MLVCIEECSGRRGKRGSQVNTTEEGGGLEVRAEDDRDASTAQRERLVDPGLPPAYDESGFVKTGVHGEKDGWVSDKYM